MPNPQLGQSRRADEIDFRLPFTQQFSVNMEARVQGLIGRQMPNPRRHLELAALLEIGEFLKFFLTQAKISVNAAGVTPSMRPA